MNGEGPDYQKLVEETRASDPVRAQAMENVLRAKGLWVSDVQRDVREAQRQGTLGAEQEAKNQVDRDNDFASMVTEAKGVSGDAQQPGHGLLGHAASTAATLTKIPGMEALQAYVRANDPRTQGDLGQSSLRDRYRASLQELRASRAALPAPVRAGAEVGSGLITQALMPGGVVAKGALAGGLSGLGSADAMSPGERLKNTAIDTGIGAGAGWVGGKIGDRVTAFRAGRAPGGLQQAFSGPGAEAGRAVASPASESGQEAVDIFRQSIRRMTPDRARSATTNFLSAAHPAPSAGPTGALKGRLAGLGRAWRGEGGGVDAATRSLVLDELDRQAQGPLLGGGLREGLRNAGHMLNPLRERTAQALGSSALRSYFGY